MVVGLAHFHTAQHEVRALKPARECACGRLTTEHDGRCASCHEQHMDIVADVHHDTEETL